MLSLYIPNLEDDEPELVTERKIYAILKEYLQPNRATAPETAAKEIDQFLPAKRPDFGVKVEPVGAFLPNLWDMFMDIARQIPSNHESQDQLVRLIHALSQLPFTIENIWGGETHVFADLPLIGAEMLEFFDSPLYTAPLYDNTIPTPEKASAYVNLSSYAARLLGSHDMISWFWMPIYELRTGLETQPWREMHPARSDCYVAVYAEWVLHSGKWLFRKFKGKNSEGDGLKGPLYKGVCYSEERWEYWERCLGDIHESGEGKVNGKTRELAGVVKQMMENVRKSEVDVSDDDESFHVAEPKLA